MNNLILIRTISMLMSSILITWVNGIEPDFYPNVNCPLNKEMCRTMCKSYKLQVPKPSVYNWCIIGCHAAERGNRHCKRKCRYTDVPTAKTRPACIHGCTTFHDEQITCGDHVHVNPQIAAHHERILEEARVEKEEKEKIKILNDDHDKLNEEHDKAHLANHIKTQKDLGNHITPHNGNVEEDVVDENEGPK